MYSTIDSVTKKIDSKLLIQLLDDENRQDQVDLTDPEDACVINFNNAATAAQEEIDPYLRQRYSLPLAIVPTRIKDLSDDITIYNCYKRRDASGIPDSIISIRKDAIATLTKIQKRELDLGIESEAEEPAATFKVNKTAADKIFNNDLMSRF